MVLKDLRLIESKFLKNLSLMGYMGITSSHFVWMYHKIQYWTPRLFTFCINDIDYTNFILLEDFF